MFETKGDLPEWRIIYDHVRALDVGQAVTYEVLDGLLGRNFFTSRTPIYRAMRELEDNDSRTLANVMGVGYRMVSAEEHEGLARHHHGKGRRSVRRAVRKLASARREEMTREQARRCDDMQVQLDQHAQMMRRLDRRVTRVETELPDQIDRRVLELLARHGVTVNAEPEQTNA